MVLQAPLVSTYDKQRQVLASTSWLTGMVGGRGTGKSTIGALDIIQKAKDGEPYMAVSPTFGDVSDVTWPIFEALCHELGVWISGVRSPLPRIWFHTQDGGKADIVFRTGEEPDSLRGPSKAGLWLDEPSVMHHDVFKIGIGVLRHRGRMGRCLLTFTPKGRRHWTYGVFFERQGDLDVPRPNTTLIQAHTLDNPFLPDEFYESIRSQYTSGLAQQELAGEFVDLEGLLFKREWFLPLASELPRVADRVRYWDRALLPNSGCFTAGVLMARDRNGIFWIEDVVRGQWSPHDRDKRIRDTAETDAKRYRNQVLIFVEQEPGSGGKESMLQCIRMLAGFPVRRDLPSRGRRERVVAGEKFPGEAKWVRAQPLAAQAEAGNVKMLRAAWTEELLSELTSFPESKYCDQVDAASGALNKLAQMFALGGNMTPARAEAPEPEPGERYGVQVANGHGGHAGWFRRT